MSSPSSEVDLYCYESIQDLDNQTPEYGEPIESDIEGGDLSATGWSEEEGSQAPSEYGPTMDWTAALPSVDELVSPIEEPVSRQTSNAWFGNIGEAGPSSRNARQETNPGLAVGENEGPLLPGNIDGSCCPTHAKIVKFYSNGFEPTTASEHGRVFHYIYGISNKDIPGFVERARRCLGRSNRHHSNMVRTLLQV